MKIENIEKEIDGMVARLLSLARELTWNKISDHCLFIISEINIIEPKQFHKLINKNNKKIPKPLSEIIPILTELYPNIYDLNLSIYKALKEVTFIEISFYPRSSLDQEYREAVADTETMLHCKIATPPYCLDKKVIFDIHWQFGTINHKWKLFWWQLKMQVIIIKRKLINL